MENDALSKATPKDARDDELVMTLVDLALAQPKGRREAFLRNACGNDSQLFNLARSYVQSEERMQGFLLDPLFPPDEPEHPFEPGTLVDNRFRIIREIARGGMGIVYQAFDEKLEKRIAIKCGKTGFRKRLPPEVRSASEITHPNVCRIFEIHTTSTGGGETDFITMEFLEGGTLAERMEKGRLPEEQVRLISQQLCAGLAEAHRSRVIHGDLKSNNVILTQSADGSTRAVITDFGLARSPEATDLAVMTSTGAGAPDYMAPELLHGQKPSVASDIYALGIILHEVATGQKPRGPEVPPERRINTKRLLPPWPRALARCLDPDPAKRFASAADVAVALAPPSRRLFLAAMAASVGALVGGAIYLREAGGGLPSVAVIPFINSQATPESEYLSTGISESLTHALAQLPNLKVIATSSSFRFSGDRLDARQAAKTLGVRTLVTGRVLQMNGRVRVSAELVNAEDGAVIWGAEYNPSLADLTYIQAQISGEIAQRVGSQLTQAERRKLAKGTNVNPEAYALLLQGRYQMRLYTPDSTQKAARYFEQALGIDPRFALANTELANTYRRLSGAGILKSPGTLALAEKAVLRALAADQDLGEAHAVLADIKKDQWDWAAAEREYRRALELNPNLASAREGLAISLSVAGKYDAAVEEVLRARDLDPIGLANTIDTAAVYYNVRRYDQALETLKRATTLDGHAPAVWTWVGIVNGGSGRFPQAIEAFDKAIQLGDNTGATKCYLVYALAHSGKRDEARKLLESLRQSGEIIAPSALAIAYTGLDQKDRALELLESGYTSRDQLLQYITVESHFDALRSDQRFQQLVAKLGLPQ